MKKDLTYEQAVALGDIERKVKNHIKDNYPDNYYGKPNSILGRFGHSLSKTSWLKVERLAKTDSTLHNLISQYKQMLISLGY